MGIRTPLARVRGLGSAKEGVQHWWMQRLSAIALVPLSLWFIFAMAGHAGFDHGQAVQWIGRPVNAVLLILLVATSFYHGQLGLQVVIEDYVHGEASKLASIIAVKFLAALLAVGTIFAILHISFGS